MSESDRPPPVDTYAAVYEREFGYVWKTLGRLGVASGDIADAVHDVFVVVHRRWSEIDPARPIRPWLFGVARRCAASHRRKQRESPRDDLDPAAPADDQLVLRDLLWRALADLDEDQRDVVVLHDLDGFTGVEIAALLDVPGNTVHSRLRLGRAALAVTITRLRGRP